MTIPLRNTIYDKIKEVNSLTDVELYKSLTKDGLNIPEDKFNKLLLDLEILGLIKVVWFTKDERRIEVIIIKKEEDPIEEQNKEWLLKFVRLQKQVDDQLDGRNQVNKAYGEMFANLQKQIELLTIKT